MAKKRFGYGLKVGRHEWEETVDGELAMVGEHRMVRWYDPMVDAPDLWIRFASLDEDLPTEILQFANRFGALGAGINVDDLQLASGEVVRRASTYSDWRNAILRFRKVLEAYRLGEHVDDAVDWSIREHTQGRFRARQAILEPKGAAGAVWLQLAHLIQAGTCVGQCAGPGCDNYFAMTKRGRYPKRFCNDTCRKRAERASP